MSFFQTIKNWANSIVHAVQVKISNVLLYLFWKYNYVMIQIEDSKVSQIWKPVSTKLVEPMFESWICVASIESGSLLEKYVLGETEISNADEKSITIYKIDNQLRVKPSADETKYESVFAPSNVKFLSVLYEHPQVKEPLRLIIDPKYMLVGNYLLNDVFVLRLLRHQYNKCDFVFDNRYKLRIMDSNIMMSCIESNQAIILDANKYIISPPPKN
jgi:hypothetical protein